MRILAAMTLACALTAPRTWAEEMHVVSPSELRQEIGTAGEKPERA